ncbi:MAG: hypothetical protein OXF79_20815 [Chloroflexi bacterium]|nr:hypothetical protein [Chloroflexota bacterium]
MFSLPIPSGDRERFEDLQHGDLDIATVVTGITSGRISGRERVHLDPDLNFNAYRHAKTVPLGNSGEGCSAWPASRRGTSKGRALAPATSSCSSASTTEWRKPPNDGTSSVAPRDPRPVGLGYIDQKYRVADIGPNDLPWARHHPHLSGSYRGNQNTVYAATRIWT